jgi:hypothetical protein
MASIQILPETAERLHTLTRVVRLKNSWNKAKYFLACLSGVGTLEPSLFASQDGNKVRDPHRYIIDVPPYDE